MKSGYSPITLTKKLYIGTVVILTVCTLPWAHRLYEVNLGISAMEAAILRQAERNEKQFDQMVDYLARQLEAWHPKDDRYERHFAFADTLRGIQYKSHQPLSTQINKLLDHFTPYLPNWQGEEKSFEEFFEYKINLWDEELEYRYYKSHIIADLFTDMICSCHCSLCISRWEVIRIPRPQDNTYHVYLGSAGDCEHPYSMRVNGTKIDENYKWCYTPLKTGIDSIMIEIQDFDYGLEKYVVDTVYYPIRVVDPNDPPEHS